MKSLSSSTKHIVVCAWVAVIMFSGAPALPDANGSVATGDLRLNYQFAPTGETVPYRLFVPHSYHGEKDYPMVVVLHGGGASQDSPLENTGLEQIAEKRGYIVLSPLGYNRFGGFGNIYPVVVTPSAAAASTAFATISRSEHPASIARPQAAGSSLPPAKEDEYEEQAAGELTDAHVAALSEAETLAAIANVRQLYHVAASRIYLMGNSAGGVGTLYLAAKYPQMWAAIAPQGGVIAAWSFPYWRLRDSGVAALFVHGARDEHCNAKWSRAMVRSARDNGVDATFLLVDGGTHQGAWREALPQIFDFFDAHTRT